MFPLETIMLVALGFSVAALIALFLARLVFGYAVGVGKRRLEQSTPTALSHLQADRDRLRAEYAMLARKLELRLDELKMKLIEQTGEVSRNRNRIEVLGSEIKKRDALLAERNQEIANLREHVSPLEGDLTARTEAIRSLKDELRRRDDEIETLRRAVHMASNDVADRDRQIAVLRAGMAVDSEIALPHDAQNAHDRLRRRIDGLAQLSMQIEAQRRQLDQQQTQFRTMRQEVVRSRTASAVPQPGRESGREERALPRLGEPRARPEPRLPGLSTGGGREREAALEPPPAPASAAALEDESRHLERQILQAEQETNELQEELERLDQVWSNKLAELGLAGEQQQPMANQPMAQHQPVAQQRQMPEPVSPPPSRPAPAASLPIERPEPAMPMLLGPPEPVRLEAPVNGRDSDHMDVEEVEPVQAAASEGGRRAHRALTNVISLAARIRALQKDITK